MLLTDMIIAGAERHGPRIAVRFGQDTLSFSEVDAISTGMGAAIGRAASARQHDRHPGG
jgi:hypothetical protein